jgi:hypothetical protein
MSEQVNQNLTLAQIANEFNQEEALAYALQYIQGTIGAESITRTDRIKAAIVGERKSGKSWLVAKTCRKPCLVDDFDDRKESIAGTPGVIIKQYLDTDPNIPRAWGTLESDVGTLEYLKKENKLPFKSICLDSMTYLRLIAENQMMQDTNMYRKYKIGTYEYRISQGWDSVVDVQKMLHGLLLRLFALDIDVYTIWHTRPEKDKAKSTSKEAVYTDRLTVDPQNLEVLLSMFNETWRCYIDENNNFKLQTRADWRFNAATALKIDPVEDPSIENLLIKHEANMKK